jgi:bifunctional DNA-binding transcriptional regulator/antitoxin component of YhaV-PrlF toxin-antitoxin module
MSTVIVTLNAKRRLSIPVTLAPAKPGDQLDARFDAEEGTVILRRAPKKRSWLKVLKRRPVSTDNLPSHSPGASEEAQALFNPFKELPSG